MGPAKQWVNTMTMRTPAENRKQTGVKLLLGGIALAVSGIGFGVAWKTWMAYPMVILGLLAAGMAAAIYLISGNDNG